MNIGIQDVDNTGYPNLALMKISAHHKSVGDDVSWYNPLFGADVVYASKVFTFSKDDEMLPIDANRGGSGHNSKLSLPENIEHIMPDYSIYNTDHSMGFLTRGCPRSCSWCVVPSKEGKIKAHADIEEFLAHDKCVLMDNNVLAHDHGLKQIEKIGNLGCKIDFNQGLDARLIDKANARLLGKCKWWKPVRIACDTKSQMKSVAKAVDILRSNNVTPRRYFCYVLVKDIADALERVMFLDSIGVDPFAQPYRDFSTNTEPTTEQRRFARWVNHKAIFRSTKWSEYA